MYGWVLDCFQLFAQARWGPSAWRIIRSQPLSKDLLLLDTEDNKEEGSTSSSSSSSLLLPTLGGFIRHKYYPDSLSVHLFVTSSNIFQEDFDLVLESFGEFFIQYYERSNYSHMLRSVASTLQTFLNSVNRIHANLQIALPNLIPPDLLTFTLKENFEKEEGPRCPRGKEDTSSCLYLLYRSKRQGLGPLTKGVVKASAREFVGFEVNVDEINDIPDCIDTNCPSIFVDTFTKRNNSSNNNKEGEDEKIDDDGNNNCEDTISYGNIKLFRITAVNPMFSYLLLEDGENMNIKRNEVGGEGEQISTNENNNQDTRTSRCPFTGMKLNSTEEKTGATSSKGNDRSDDGKAKEESNSKHDENDNDLLPSEDLVVDGGQFRKDRISTTSTAAATFPYGNSTTILYDENENDDDDDVEKKRSFVDEEKQSTTTTNLLCSTFSEFEVDKDIPNNHQSNGLRRRRQSRRSTDGISSRRSRRMSYQNSCISLNTAQNWLSRDDIEKIFHFYIIVSPAGDDDDSLVVDDIGTDILGRATSIDDDPNHIFNTFKEKMDELERNGEKFQSNNLFDFVSPPIQHTYTALDSNANAPIVVLIRNTMSSPCPHNNNQQPQHIRRSYLFKPVVLSNKRILLYGTPLVRTLQQVKQHGLDLSELSPETKDLVCLTEHFAAEVASSKKLDQANKALVDNQKQKLWIKLSKQMRKQRVARFVFLLCFFGLDVVDVITNWLGYEEIVTNPNLTVMVNPYFAFLIIISIIMVGVLVMSIKEMIEIGIQLYRDEMKIECAKDGTTGGGDNGITSFESKVKRLKILKGKIRSGIFDIVTAMIDDASMTIFSVIGLKFSNYAEDDITSSPLFVSMCISLLVLGFKLRSIESLLTNYRELSEVTREKEEMQLDSLKTVTTNNNRNREHITKQNPKTTTTSLSEEELHQRLQQQEEKKDRIGVVESIVDIVDFIA